jgi:hypothetical protein
MQHGPDEILGPETSVGRPYPGKPSHAGSRYSYARGGPRLAGGSLDQFGVFSDLHGKHERGLIARRHLDHANTV